MEDMDPRIKTVTKCSDEGLILKSLYGGQFTSSTLMIKPNISDCRHFFWGHVPDIPKFNIKHNDPNLGGGGCETISMGGEVPFRY